MSVLVGGIPGASSRLSGGLTGVAPNMFSDVTPMLIATPQSRLAGKFRRSINGVTKDSTGAALGACSVAVLRTATDVKVDGALSDAGGSYDISVYDDGPFYAIAYKAGAPDVAGTTVNTLTGV